MLTVERGEGGTSQVEELMCKPAARGTPWHQWLPLLTAWIVSGFQGVIIIRRASEAHVITCLCSVMPAPEFGNMYVPLVKVSCGLLNVFYLCDFSRQAGYKEGLAVKLTRKCDGRELTQPVGRAGPIKPSRPAPFPDFKFAAFKRADL